MFRSFRTWALSVILMLSAGCVSTEQVRIDQNTLGNTNHERLTIPGEAFLPDAPPPWPAVVLLHDSGGYDEHHRNWGRRLAGWGYYVLAPDSFRARGVTDISKDAGLVTSYRRLPDSLAALKTLQADPRIQSDKIALLGLSHGALVAHRVAQNEYWKLFGISIKPAAAVSIYGHCAPGEFDYPSIPVLIILGDRDDFLNVADCASHQSRLSEKHRPFVSTVVLPGATHAFDRPLPRRTVNWIGGYDGAVAPRTMEYSHSATAAAEREIRSFLNRHLK